MLTESGSSAKNSLQLKNRFGCSTFYRSILLWLLWRIEFSLLSSISHLLNLNILTYIFVTYLHLSYSFLIFERNSAAQQINGVQTWTSEQHATYIRLSVLCIVHRSRAHFIRLCRKYYIKISREKIFKNNKIHIFWNCFILVRLLCFFNVFIRGYRKKEWTKRSQDDVEHRTFHPKCDHLFFYTSLKWKHTDFISFNSIMRCIQVFYVSAIHSFPFPLPLPAVCRSNNWRK